MLKTSMMMKKMIDAIFLMWLVMGVCVLVYGIINTPLLMVILAASIWLFCKVLGK